MDIPKEFFTLQSMMTLTGATGATFVVSNGLQRAFDFNPKWLALVIAVTICLFGVMATNGRPSDYFVGLINGFLVYCTAAGATGIIGEGSKPRAVARGAEDAARPQNQSNKRGFFTSWY